MSSSTNSDKNLSSESEEVKICHKKIEFSETNSSSSHDIEDVVIGDKNVMSTDLDTSFDNYNTTSKSNVNRYDYCESDTWDVLKKVGIVLVIILLCSVVVILSVILT